MNVESINTNHRLVDDFYPGSVRKENGQIDESKLLNILKGDYDSCRIYTEQQMAKIYQWRREYDGQPYGNEVEGRSRFISRDIKKHSAWLQASILDTFTSTPDIIRCYPTNPQSTKAARGNETILNYQFCRKFNRYDFMAKAISILDIDGTCVVKTGWEYETEIRPMRHITKIPLVDEQTGQPVKDEFGAVVEQIIEDYEQDEEVVISNNPTAVLCRNEDIFIDPTCLGDLDKARFIIHRYRTDYSTLQSEGIYKNLDDLPYMTEDPMYRKKESFHFQDKARRKLIVYEYWGYYDMNDDGIAEPIICAWVDNTIIRLEENPYPDKKPPFIICPFLPKAFDVYGDSNSEMLSSNQKIKTVITRGIIDNMAISNNAQLIVKKGALDSANRKKMLEGKSFETNYDPNQTVMVGNFNQLPSSLFNFAQMVDADSQALTGVNTFGQNVSSDRIGQDASSKGALDGGNLRKLQIVRNIADNLVKPLLRKWISYNSLFLDDQMTIRITGEHFETVKRDDLYGEIDLDLAISTNEDNAMRIQTIGFILQTIGPNSDPVVTKGLMAEILRLHKMPEMAKRLENYTPEPDPLLVMQQQLMIEKLKAEIEELQANAGKIQSDSILKQSKAQVESERAKNVSANTDNINLEYARKTQGLDEASKMAQVQEQNASKERIAKMTQDAKLASDLIKLQGEKMKAEQASLKQSASYSPKQKKEPRNDIKYHSSPKSED